MTKKEIINKLKTWEKRITFANQVYEDLHRLYMAAPESPVSTAIFQSVEAYTDALEQNITRNASDNWLSWYWLENAMGKNGMQANPGTWDDVRPIRNLSELADLLIASKEADTEKHALVVEVRGGVVQAIHASLDESEVVTSVIDFDSCEEDRVDQYVSISEQAHKNLNLIWG